MTIADDAVITATFSDYRTVKGRKVLQIIFEVPIEQQGKIFAALGYPMPDAERWCAIALLRDPAPVEPERPSSAATGNGSSAGAHIKDPARSMVGKARYAESDDMQKAVTRAAMLAHDPAFRDWIGKNKFMSVEEADLAIKRQCNIASKRDLATDEGSYRAFLRLETDFLIYAGRLPEPR